MNGFDGYLEGAPELEAFIVLNGDREDYDDEVVRRVAAANVLMLGRPTLTAPGLRAHLLHCEVPYRGEVVKLLPMWTRLDHVAKAVTVNPDWGQLQVFVLRGDEALLDLAGDEWLGINVWTGNEFKLPPAHPRTDWRHPYDGTPWTDL